MPARRARAGARFTRTQRQPTNWARDVDVALVLLPANSKVILATVVLSNPGINETVRRTRGAVIVTSDQEAVQEEQLGAVGAIVVSDQAVGVGVGSLPDPVSDASDDGWFMWMPFLQMTMTTLGGTSPARSVAQYEFDSKAMRRVEEGFTVAFIAANSSPSTGLEIAFSVSILTSLS